MPAARLLHMGAAEAGQAGAQPICRLSPEARGRHLRGGTGEPLKLYWLRAAPPSPAAGQHVRAGKGAGFKFENPAVGAGLSGEPGRNAQALGEGLRIPLRAPGSVLWPGLLAICPCGPCRASASYCGEWEWSPGSSSSPPAGKLLLSL